MSDYNFLDICVRLAYNTLTAFLIVRFVYYRREKKREFLFTFFIFNLLTFFVCAFLKHIVLDIGFAFGLFAVFHVLRYRTESIPIREMTYHFLVITLGALNGVADVGTWHPELVFMDVVILAMVFALDGKILFKEECSQTVKYDKIELIRPAQSRELLDDLKTRTGLDIYRLKIGKIDFIRDAAEITVYYWDGATSSRSRGSGHAENGRGKRP